jgi:cytochrome oxidase Cu insertion factor (SCO1/SenC/PrrC family)
MKKVLIITIVLLITASAAPAQSRRFREFPNTSPKAGEKAPDFKSVNEKGEKVTLSQFKNKKHLVLITGSIT